MSKQVKGVEITNVRYKNSMFYPSHEGDRIRNKIAYQQKLNTSLSYKKEWPST
jgi:hypothetical protein